MEFEEFVSGDFGIWDDDSTFEYKLAKRAWDAAFVACASICEAEGEGHRDGFGKHCAEMIRRKK